MVLQGGALVQGYMRSGPRVRLTAGAVLCLATASAGLCDIKPQPDITSHAVRVLLVDGLRFRDLNRNGRLDPYEDWRLSPRRRAHDLLARMSLPEKAGQMVFPNAFNAASPGGKGVGYEMEAVKALVHEHHVTAFSSMLSGDARDLARASNAIQDLCEAERLGIPAVIGTDPRHGYQKMIGASVATGSFSQWPDPTGLAAIGDSALVRRFASIVRRDYRLVGFTVALGPQADLATEPRWPRINGTFGEDPVTVEALVPAYIEGIQGGADGLQSFGVASVVKHFVGYGAAYQGLDSHNYYGRYAALTSGELATHLRPFEAAFRVHPAGVMPAYSVFRGLAIDGRPVGEVGAAYSAPLITGLLRKHLRFDGIVLSDWAIAQDCDATCREGYPAAERPGFRGISMAWGVESLSRPERFAKAIKAGVDQFGGDRDPSAIVEAVDKGLVSERQIDQSVEKILAQSFELGLFEHPFVDPEAAASNVGTAAAQSLGAKTQAQAMVLLENNGVLPLKPGSCKVFLRGVDPAAARAAGFVVVAKPEDANVAIVRTATPFQILHPNFFFGSMQHEGSLAFAASNPDLEAIETLSAQLPTIVDIYLDRPAILTPIKPHVAALIGDFGASDAALFSVITAKTKAIGRLPFELPSSMTAVEAQKSDVPADSAAPLYPIHFHRAY